MINKIDLRLAKLIYSIHQEIRLILKQLGVLVYVLEIRSNKDAFKSLGRYYPYKINSKKKIRVSLHLPFYPSAIIHRFNLFPSPPRSRSTP